MITLIYIYTSLMSILNDIISTLGLNLKPQHLLAFSLGLILHTISYSVKNKVLPWDLWLFDKRWTVATLIAAATTLFTLDDMYHPKLTISSYIIYFVSGVFCNTFFNSNPETLKSKIEERLQKKLSKGVLE